MERYELFERLKMEKKNYSCFNSYKDSLRAFLCHDRDYMVYKFLKYLRKTEYHYNCKNTSKLHYIPYLFYKNLKNRLGQKIGLDIGENAFDSGVYFAHTNIIVGSAKIGKNCKLHGQNCIGSGAVIGDNCELWVGAKVFGPAVLANNITVAAGAIVISSFYEDGIIIGGVPAKKLKEKGICNE